MDRRICSARSIRYEVNRLRAGELLAVDDGSSDDTFEILQRYQSIDARIRPFRRCQNNGPVAARNHALRYALGATIAYLDCDDEYYPHDLANIDRRRAQSDVLVFAYDLNDEREECPSCGQISTHYLSRVRTLLMTQNIVTPLGVAHRRDLFEKSSLFDEDRYFEQD